MTTSQPKIMVIIPAHNEQNTIHHVVAGITAQEIHTIIVVDDASTDQTAQRAKEAGALVLPLQIKMGAWGATQTGIRYAIKHQSDTIITMDGDGQHNSKYISHLLQECTTMNTDIVIAADISRGSWQRHLAWKIFRLITGLNLNDLTSGFRLYNKKAMALLASPQATLLDYQDIGVLLLLQKNHLTLGETRIHMEERMIGHSHIFFSWFAVFKYMTYSMILSCSRRNHILFPSQQSKKND